MVLSLGGDDKVENAQSETMLIGDQFARAGDHMVAQAQYKAAFDMDPRNAMAAYKAAKSLWQINQTRDAIHWLEKSIQADPKFIQAYILKADYESQKYNFSEAAKTLQMATRKFSQSHEIMKAQALMEFRKNNMLGAIQYGERAVKIYNADVELLSMLAQAYIYYYLNAPSVGKDAIKKKKMPKKKRSNTPRAQPTWNRPGRRRRSPAPKLLRPLRGPSGEKPTSKNLLRPIPIRLSTA
jgi:tetratricopeptide (TPR) repeat protein